MPTAAKGVPHMSFIMRAHMHVRKVGSSAQTSSRARTANIHSFLPPPPLSLPTAPVFSSCLLNATMYTKYTTDRQTHAAHTPPCAPCTCKHGPARARTAELVSCPHEVCASATASHTPKRHQTKHSLDQNHPAHFPPMPTRSILVQE